MKAWSYRRKACYNILLARIIDAVRWHCPQMYMSCPHHRCLVRVRRWVATACEISSGGSMPQFSGRKRSKLSGKTKNGYEVGNVEHVAVSRSLSVRAHSALRYHLLGETRTNLFTSLAMVHGKISCSALLR